MSDENAEKAWRTQHPYVARSPIFDKGYAAGRVSRDAEVAELRAHPDPNNIWTKAADEARIAAQRQVESLREQLTAERTRADKAEVKLKLNGSMPIDTARVIDRLGHENERLREVVERVRVRLTGPMPTTDGVLPWLREAVAILDAVPVEPQGDHENGARP